MIWKWMEPAIAHVEGGRVDTAVFELAYYTKYKTKLEQAAGSLGWPADKQATSFGIYQILGENLARYSNMTMQDLTAFLMDPTMQYRIAEQHFYRILNQVIERRGSSWPQYVFSCWNAGVNYNEAYSVKVRAFLKV